MTGKLRPRAPCYWQLFLQLSVEALLELQLKGRLARQCPCASFQLEVQLQGSHQGRHGLLEGGAQGRMLSGRRAALGGSAHGEQSGSGKMTGMVNQKVDPKAALEDAPICPPSTATCLLQMLRPRPVPPALLGRFMSSSVPCTTPHRLIALSRCM